jgi:transcriptional regulator with XRE-family HTH domain
MNPSAFLKQHRKQNNLTQQELAAKAGVGLRLVRERKISEFAILKNGEI